MPKAKVFVSYSHRDRAWKDRLVGHLQVLEREDALDLWDDDRIPAGADWLAEIQGAIRSARVAVLLVSVDFLNSRFIREMEIPELLARGKAEGLHVFPVIVDECLWEEVPEISSIQSRPLGGRPLASFRGTGRTHELVAIAREILRLVATDPAPSVSASAGALRPLHQLPSPPADFVGREAELTELRSAMRKGGFTICGLQGMGGVGKTALALRLAHEFCDAYPDGQIYLDLRGVSEKPVTSDEAMAHVIRAFHPEAKVPEGDQLAALYREVLHGKRALLLMDNASGKEQVDPLLPPEGCALLVTSRSRFSLPGIFRHDLDQLTESDARTLLLTIEKRIGDQVGTIASLCGCLPFALRVAANALADQPGLTVAGYVQRLAQEDQKARLGEGALGLSYALLPGTLQARLHSLSVFPTDFDAPAATAVWGLDEKSTEADESLDDLVQRSLLEGDEGRYKLHDLVRAFAAGRCLEKEFEEARARHAGYYLKVVQTAKELHRKGKEHILRSFALFDRERANTLAGQVWAAERTATCEVAAGYARDFARAGSHLLRRLSSSARIDWVKAGVLGARKLHDHNLEGINLGYLGEAYSDLGDTKGAIAIYEQRLAIARGIGDQREECKALGELGDAYIALRDNRRAIEYHEKRYATAVKIGYTPGKGKALDSLARAHFHLGETQRAIDLFNTALLIFRSIGDKGKKSEGQVLGNLGNAYAALGNTQTAIGFCKQHLALARKVGDRSGQADALGNLGRVYTVLGDNRRAVAVSEKQLRIARELGDRRREGKALAYIGRAYFNLDETRLAIEIYQQVLAIILELDDRLNEATLSWNLGEAYEKIGEIELAVASMQICVEFERGRGHPDAEKRAAHLEALRARLPLPDNGSKS